MVILDTNIIIDHLRTEGKHQSILEKLINKSHLENPAISIITIQELYAGQSSKNADKEGYLLSTISGLTILSYSYETAQLAGEIVRDFARPIEFADAAIAATAIINHCSLLTLNQKDFVGIKDLLFS